MVKRIFISAIALLVTLQVEAQPAGVIERLYVATDRTLYVAGDDLWCSVFNLSVEDKGISVSDFSSTAYLELQTEDKVVLTAKMALVHGRGAGAIELPPTLPTGNYNLVAYTSHNRNESGFEPVGKVISVFNVLTTDRVEENVDLTQEGLMVASPVVNAAATRSVSDIKVTFVEDVIKSGEEFHIGLENHLQEWATMSVSIYHKNPFETKVDSGIVNFAEYVTHSEKGEVSTIYVPDYEGEVIRLKVSGNMEDMMHVSFPGGEIDYYASKISPDGEALLVTPNIYGDRDMICEGGQDIEMYDPFLRKIVGNVPKLRLYPEMESELLERGFSMQIGRRFEADTLYEMLPVRKSVVLDKDKVVYKLDDYTRFPKMEEVLVEFVSEIKVRTVKREKKLSILIKPEMGDPYFSSANSLVMLDGVPVTDQSRIIDLDPLSVREIEIYQGLYSVGDSFCEGIANFITYKGDMAGFEFGSNVKILPYKGSLYPLAFTGSTIKGDGEYPDYRQTIYWHPVVDMSAKEVKNIRCIAPLYEGDFQIVIEGVTASGKAVYYQDEFKVVPR